MKPVVQILLAVLFSATTTTVLAQKPKPSPGGHSTQKFKPPKLTSTLGIRSDSATVEVEEALQLINLPLKITDDKKNLYSISSYQVMYKRKGVTEDEETGKVSPASSNVAQLFRETPLPAIWKKVLTEQLRSGEELYFFDIIAKDAQGRYMFAPELRIKVK
ncbi:MAG: hypothetical protein IPP96_15635 [Chitinophagaceae bacterium]|nr:hypothetical protein [Chitinophagaceae bacterium]